MAADFEQWIEEHSDYLYRYAFRYFRSREVAEDLVQEVFLAALKSDFEGRSASRTWLTAILRHKIIDRMRAQTRENQRRADFDDGGGYSDKLFDEQEHWTAEAGPVVWSSSPESVLEQKQFLQAVESCLAKVPEKFRQIFLLREYDGLARAEVSEQLGLSSNNIGVILHRTRLMLQSCLQVNWFRALSLGDER